MLREPCNIKQTVLNGLYMSSTKYPVYIQGICWDVSMYPVDPHLGGQGELGSSRGSSARTGIHCKAVHVQSPLVSCASP